MKVFKDLRGNYKWDPLHYVDFKLLQNTREDVYLYLGHYVKEPLKNNKINVYIEFEQPNCCYGGEESRAYKDMINREKTFDKIFTITKHAAIKRNEILGKDLYDYCLFPFSKNYLPNEDKKIYDYFVSGHWYGDKYCLQREVLGPAFNSIQKKRPKTKGKIISGYHDGPNYTYQQKLQHNAMSKISVVWNHQEVSERFLGDLDSLQSNIQEFRKDATGHWCINQHKARVMEGFISKTLVMVYKDPFNYIEDFYTPDEHFLYYENAEDLLDKMEHVLDNYDSPKYQNMIKKGYERAIDIHETQAFYNTYLKDL